MALSRRDFLLTAGAGVAVGVAGCAGEPRLAGRASREHPVGNGRSNDAQDDWEDIRASFDLDYDWVHLAALLLASHPRPVRDAIERQRRELDENPAHYIEENGSRLDGEVREAAARYLGADPDDIALTDSTTMGLALVYNGVEIREGQEFLTTTEDYHSTHRSLRYKAQRSGASVREISLFEDIQAVRADEMVDTLIGEIRPETRMLALTWVHSKTGLKIPVRRIADRLSDVNRDREPADRVLLGLDSVHAIGVEDVDVGDLGCDFFIAGTHKWLFAPRGSGIIWGNPRTRGAVSPTIPTFTRGAGWGGAMTPGGFKPFEHQWAHVEAFEFHRQIGKAKVTARIHELAGQIKAGLAQMPHVTLHTPMAEDLSAGIVCFDVGGMTPAQVVAALRRRQIIATRTPYDPSHARLTPTVYNLPEEIDRTLSAVHDLS